MKTAAMGAAGAVLLAAMAGTVWAERGRGEASAKGGASTAAPVVVELFTSEGCSSCPPADEVLARLEKQNSVPIIALGQHVDYWNRLGWTDPFSSKQFSARQDEYARIFRGDGVYTPQMVVDGQAEFVGSDEARAGSAITTAARRPKASVTLTIQKIDGGVQGGNGISLSAGVGILPQGVRAGEVFAALTESGLSSQVKGGENAGRHLAHASVVRKLISIGTVGPKGGTLTQNLDLPTESRKENLRAVVFIQDKGTHRIVGAAQTKLN